MKRFISDTVVMLTLGARRVEEASNRVKMVCPKWQYEAVDIHEAMTIALQDSAYVNRFVSDTEPTTVSTEENGVVTLVTAVRGTVNQLPARMTVTLREVTPEEKEETEEYFAGACL